MTQYVRTENPKLAAVVATLKTKPPVNFNVSLKMHAIPHGVKVHEISYNGPKVSLVVSAFNFDSVRSFAGSLGAKFPHVLHEFSVRELTPGEHLRLGRSSQYAHPGAESPYVTPPGQ